MLNIRSRVCRAAKENYPNNPSHPESARTENPLASNMPTQFETKKIVLWRIRHFKGIIKIICLLKEHQ